MGFMVAVPMLMRVKQNAKFKDMKTKVREKKRGSARIKIRVTGVFSFEATIA